MVQLLNCVVTKDLSRLGRNYIMTGQYTEIYFPSKGVRYIAINDNVDTINGENELAPFLNILKNKGCLRMVVCYFPQISTIAISNGKLFPTRPSRQTDKTP